MARNSVRYSPCSLAKLVDFHSKEMEREPHPLLELDAWRESVFAAMAHEIGLADRKRRETVNRRRDQAIAERPLYGSRASGSSIRSGRSASRT
jgi:hypothetical protein